MISVSSLTNDEASERETNKLKKKSSFFPFSIFVVTDAFHFLEFSKRYETLLFEIMFRSISEMKRCQNSLSLQEKDYTESQLGENAKQILLKCILHRLRFE